MAESLQLLLVSHRGQRAGDRRRVCRIQIGKVKMVLQLPAGDLLQIAVAFLQQAIEECADEGVAGSCGIHHIDAVPFAGDAFSFAVQGSAFLALGVDDVSASSLQQLGQGCFDVGASGDELKLFIGKLEDVGIRQKLENGVSERFFIIPQGETQIRVKADQATFSCGQIKQFAMGCIAGLRPCGGKT